MNYYILTAGILAAFACIGHFAIGAKEFLKPVMNSDINEIPKKIMQSLFHYMSVFMIITTVLLLVFSTGNNLNLFYPPEIIFFIGIIYSGFAIVQFLIALTSSIKMGILKLFQWVFWALIALFSFLGYRDFPSVFGV